MTMAKQEARQQIKRRLGEYLAIKREKEQVLGKLSELEAVMTSPRSPNLDGMPRGGSGGDPMVALLSQKMALEEHYRAQLTRLMAAQAAVENMIETLGPTERKLMRHRYIEGLTWENVCVAMCYSWRQTHNIHSRALDKLSDNSL